MIDCRTARLCPQLALVLCLVTMFSRESHAWVAQFRRQALSVPLQLPHAANRRPISPAPITYRRAASQSPVHCPKSSPSSSTLLLSSSLLFSLSSGILCVYPRHKLGFDCYRSSKLVITRYQADLPPSAPHLSTYLSSAPSGLCCTACSTGSTILTGLSSFLLLSPLYKSA
jgi:hypothetical protein